MTLVGALLYKYKSYTWVLINWRGLLINSRLKGMTIGNGGLNCRGEME